MPVLNLVVARGRFPAGADVRLAGKPRTSVAGTTCTSTLEFPDDGSGVEIPRQSDTFHLCWRMSDRLSISVLGIGNNVENEMVAEAVNSAWDLQN